MSLILDALKRAEKERKEILTPFGDADPTALGPPKKKRFRVLKIIGLILLALVLAFATLVIVIARGKSHAQKAPVVTKQQPAQPAPTAQAQPKPDKPRPAPPGGWPHEQTPTPLLVPGTEGAASLDELTKPSAPIQPAPTTTPAPSAQAPSATPAPKPEPAPATAPSVAAAEETPAPEEPAPAAKPEPVPAETAPAAKGKTPPAALTQPAPLRKFREMTPEYRADFPALNVQVHFYEPEVARRFVLINEHRYKQGDRMAEGPNLLEIVPDGMILEFRGEKCLYTLTR